MLFILAYAAHHMPDGKDRVIEQHPRSGKPHHLPDLLAHFRFVAVDPAVTAERLILHKRTFFTALSGIIKKFLTVRTQLPLLPVRFFMLLSTVQADHFTHHVLFFSPFLFDIFHCFRFIAHIIPPPQAYWSAPPESCVSL